MKNKKLKGRVADVTKQVVTIRVMDVNGKNRVKPVQPHFFIRLIRPKLNKKPLYLKGF